MDRRKIPRPFDRPKPWPMHLLQQLFEQQMQAMILFPCQAWSH